METLSWCEVSSSLSAKTDLSGILGVCQKVLCETEQAAWETTFQNSSGEESTCLQEKSS